MEEMNAAKTCETIYRHFEAVNLSSMEHKVSRQISELRKV